MPALPAYVKVSLAGYGERIDPSVIQTDMERGVPKLRRTNAMSMATITATFVFLKKQDTIDFEAWWDNDIGRIGFFTMTDPRTGVARNVRFKGGEIGELKPAGASWVVATRDVVMEYLR